MNLTKKQKRDKKKKVWAKRLARLTQGVPKKFMGRAKNILDGGKRGIPTPPKQKNGTTAEATKAEEPSTEQVPA